MEYAGGVAALLIFFFVVAGNHTRRRSVSACSESWDAKSGHAHIIGLATDVIACLWAAACFYCVYLILNPPFEPVVMEIVSTVVPLVTAFAALERWRWSRRALIGISVIVLLDASCAAMRYASAYPASRGRELVDPALWQVVLSGFTGSPVFGAAIVVLASVTVVWLLRGDVRDMFERRKRARTRQWQYGIAAVIVGVYYCGLNSVGLSRNVGPQLAVIAKSRISEPPDRVALRREPTSSRVGRQ